MSSGRRVLIVGAGLTGCTVAHALHGEAGGTSGSRATASFAPRRVSVRWDNDPYLFPDPRQGWPAGKGGYTDLIDCLLGDEGIELRTGEEVTLGDVGRLLRELDPAAIVLTCPLAAFSKAPFGELDWRGILVRSTAPP